MGDSRGPYTDTDDLHVSVRTILTHYHNIKQFPHGRFPRAQITIFTSHNPQHVRSPRAQLILNLMSMHVHNIFFNRGDDDASQSINMNPIHNQLNYHNYTGEINKTQSHKEFKSIIYQLMPICFGILKFQSTFYNSIFLFITPVLVPMPVTPLIRDHHLSPLPLCLFSFLIFN